MAGRTLFDKIWDEHAILDRDGVTLLAIDRHILYEVTAAPAFEKLAAAQRTVRNPELALATIDHIVDTRPGRSAGSYAPGLALISAHREATRRHGIALLDLGDPRQGIVHVVAPELGAILPGATIVCGDSHTCTVGALGALALGIGSSDVEHVLSTQSLWLRKPRRMRITIQGALGPHVGAKDLALHIIAALGTGAGNGYAIEYAGNAVRSLEIEARFTLCNLSVELGARIGMIAPDKAVFDYLRGRDHAPHGPLWDAALAYWRTLESEPDAAFDREVSFEADAIAPMITWGTSPEDAVEIGGRVPDPAAQPTVPDGGQRCANKRRSLAYMGIAPGDRLEGLPIDMVFIGSCTNARLSDLRAAAALVRGRKVARGVRALVVPGSTRVRRDAEAEGIDRLFREAGFEWHEAGCSMCCALGPDLVPSGRRCVSTSNRNFENRQGPGARTHLAGPETAAAAAIAGRIVDVRSMGS